MRRIWADSWLSRRLKLQTYSTYVMCVLTWVLPTWKLDEAMQVEMQGKLRHWNARLLTWLLQTKPEDHLTELWRPYHELLFDLVGKLRARRLQWLANEAVPEHTMVADLAKMASQIK